MTRIAGFRLVLLFLFASVPAVAVEPQADPAAARSATENAQVATRIEGLIRQLGDEQFQVREEASRHLAELGNRARTALEQATKNDDAEIASRAKALLDSLPKLTHTVVDALGQPIPFASVTVRFPDADSRPPLPESSEQDGRIAIPEVAPEAGRPTVVVDHADYGMAAIQVDPRSENTTLRLPLVRHGSEAHKRAIQGQVVSQDGKPVSGAVIECRDVRTPGEGLIEGVVGCGHALSDDAGRFTYYMPPSEQRRSERGTLIPANSRYALRITVPGYEAYFPWVGRYSNLGPVRIELPRATKFHRFRFEAVGGDWLGSEHLEHVRIQQERFEDGKRVLIDLGTEVVSAGRKLIPGKYVAESFANGKMVEYLPLVVTEDSPEELTFELPHAVTYHGRVIDGITGEPVVGAFVMGWRSTSRNNLALLTDEDWTMLGDTSSNPPADHRAIVRLGDFYGVQAFARTDREGRFAITRKPDQEFYGLLAFAKDAVPYKVTVGKLKPDASHRVDAGEFPLFPAAKLIVRPVFEGQRLAVAPRWYPAEAGQPDWFEQFKAAGRSREREFEYVHWLVLNESQPVYVPAGLKVKVRFETPYNDKWDAAIVEGVHLDPGTIKEAGDLHFDENLPVAVRVVDRRGKPVEGVPVRQKYVDDNAWSVAHNTDADGVARFFAPPGTASQFWVSDLHGPREAQLAENLFAKFTVDTEPQTEPLMITITDQQAELLLGNGRSK